MPGHPLPPVSGTHHHTAMSTVVTVDDRCHGRYYYCHDVNTVDYGALPRASFAVTTGQHCGLLCMQSTCVLRVHIFIPVPSSHPPQAFCPPYALRKSLRRPCSILPAHGMHRLDAAIAHVVGVTVIVPGPRRTRAHIIQHPHSTRTWTNRPFIITLPNSAFRHSNLT